MIQRAWNPEKGGMAMVLLLDRHFCAGSTAPIPAFPWEEFARRR
jgi:hypothetical protein